MAGSLLDLGGSVVNGTAQTLGLAAGIAVDIAAPAVDAGLNWLQGEAAPPAGSAAAFQDTSQYMFPLDLVNNSVGRNYFINFKFVKYQRRSIFDKPSFVRGNGIQLPIPVNLMDSTNITWSSEETESAVGALIENGIKGGTASASSISSKIKESIGGALVGAGAEAVNKIAGYAGFGDVVGQGLQLYGLAQNPFLTMLFKSPTFKTHQFNWRFAPRTPQESYMLMNIIAAFKANMLPALQPGSGGVFLSYPNMAYVSLHPDDMFLYQFKPCVVTTFTVDYAAAGVPSFFKGTKAPTLVDLTVSLSEIEYWLREDILQTGDGSNLRDGGLIGQAQNLG